MTRNSVDGLEGFEKLSRWDELRESLPLIPVFAK
jgi:hypothetical protein